MLDLMTVVQAAAAAGNRRLCQRYLDRLLDFSQRHFDREESLLRRWRYPDIATHAHYHAELMHRAEAVREACTQLESPDAFAECCDELLSFLLDDVVRGDLRLKSFLDDAGLALPVQV